MSELRVNSVSEVGGDAVITSGVLDSGSLPAGAIIAVKDALFTGTQSSSVAAGGNVAVTDLSITHEVSDPANKLIISAFFGAAASSTEVASVGIAIDDGAGLINIGDAASPRTRTTAGGRTVSNVRNDVVTMPSVTFVHAPGAGSKTYTVHAINIAGSSRTLYVNRSQGDGSNDARAVSSLVIQEVAV